MAPWTATTGPTRRVPGVRAEFSACWARSRCRSSSRSSISRVRVTRSLKEESRSRTRRSFISSDNPLRYAVRSALSSQPLSAARVRNSKVYSAMLRGPYKMLCSRPAASALLEGWSNVFLNSSANSWRLDDSCGLFPTAAMAQSRARSDRDKMMRVTLAPSDRNREGWWRKRSWHSPRKPRHLSNSPE